MPPAAPAPAPLAPAGLPAVRQDPNALWREVVREVRQQKKEMLAVALAHARVLAVEAGRVRLGFTHQEGMFRRQVERLQREVESALAKVLHEPAGLALETVAPDEGGLSLAEAESERARQREEKLSRDARESPVVLAAMKILGATVESVRVLEEQEEPSEAPPLPEEDSEEAEG